MATYSLPLLSKPLSNSINPSLYHTPKTPFRSLAHPNPNPNPNPNSNHYPCNLTLTLTKRGLGLGPTFRVAAIDDYSSKRISSSNNGEQRETIMLPGCDYNHWLIVMDFPKDPSPTREQMIDTYLDTLATVLGRNRQLDYMGNVLLCCLIIQLMDHPPWCTTPSMEEAKKNMYAFSTTTYTGFQCTVDEETSEKFKGLPGVLWVLPDSYIDVKNKDYGGDKYINGEIIPCKYPTYQPKKRDPPKYAGRRYERRRDGPPGASGKPRQETASSESASS